MNIKVYNDANKFLEDYEDSLLKEEAVNQLILANLYLYKENNVNNNIFGAIINDNQPVLLFLNAYPFNLLTYSLKLSREAYECLIEYIINNNVLIRGINSYYDDATLFIEIYKKYKNVNFKPHLKMDIMLLEKVIEPKLCKGSFEPGSLDDIDIIVDYIIKFNDECTHEVLDLEKLRERIINKINRGDQYVFKNEDNFIVAIANVNRQMKNGICISGVYTNKLYRGKGYCSTIMYYISKLYLEKGNKYISLFVDKENPISNKVYLKVGYQIVKNNYDYRIDQDI